MEAISFSHENTTHSNSEIEATATRLVDQGDFTWGRYYHQSLNGKHQKFLAKSFITDIYKTFDPLNSGGDGSHSFAHHLHSNYRGYLMIEQRQYHIYHCDRNNEFYLYVRPSDGFVLAFTCRCEAPLRS